MCRTLAKLERRGAIEILPGRVRLIAEPNELLAAWGGVQDAMFQWWYGHNAVGFFPTAGFLAILYYFIPKRAQRHIHSYRLSIVHF